MYLEKYLRVHRGRPGSEMTSLQLLIVFRLFRERKSDYVRKIQREGY